MFSAIKACTVKIQLQNYVITLLKCTFRSFQASFIWGFQMCYSAFTLSFRWWCGPRSFGKWHEFVIWEFILYMQYAVGNHSAPSKWSAQPQSVAVLGIRRAAAHVSTAEGAAVSASAHYGSQVGMRDLPPFC